MVSPRTSAGKAETNGRCDDSDEIGYLADHVATLAALSAPVAPPELSDDVAQRIALLPREARAEIVNRATSKVPGSAVPFVRDFVDRAERARRRAATGAPELSPAALYGPLGALVDLRAPYTEASRAAMLASVLAAFGNIITGRPHFNIDPEAHRGNLFVLVVGETQRGAKGRSWHQAKALVSGLDPGWDKACFRSGFGSGESLVRELHHREQAGRDSRLLVVETEFSSVLTVAGREGSTLSEKYRQVFDGGPVSNVIAGSKNGEPAVHESTKHHVSAIGHVTPRALQRAIDKSTIVEDGFLNRFLFIYSERSRRLPHGHDLPPDVLAEVNQIKNGLAEQLAYIRGLGRMELSPSAVDDWDKYYDPLTTDNGPLSDLRARAAALVRRLSIIYAAADATNVIGPAHQDAAMALWKYSDDSIRYVLGGGGSGGLSPTGSPDADKLLEALRAAGPAGLKRGQIFALFGRNVHASYIANLIRILLDSDLVYPEERSGNSMLVRAK